MVGDQIETLDSTSLPLEEQGPVLALLHKYNAMFSVHDGDLGCTTPKIS